MRSSAVFVSLIAVASAAAVLPRQAETPKIFMGDCTGKVNKVSAARLDTSPIGLTPPGSATIGGKEINTFRDWNSSEPFEINLSGRVSDPPRPFKAQLGERPGDEEPQVGEKVGSGTLQTEDGEEIKMKCVKAAQEKFEFGGMNCVQMVVCAPEN